MNRGPGERRPRDSTPPVTRAALVASLILTAAIFAVIARRPAASRVDAGVVMALWVLTGLFVLRVSGQVLVALRPRSWLPPMEQWNLIPYRLLLPIQILFIGAMLWIDIEFTRGGGIARADVAGFGTLLLLFSAVYAISMLVRYIVRMARRPDQRWFGGTIPIVFHLVLAVYVFALGSVYAG